LEEGHLTCIFAEGQISRLGGATLGFKRGLEVILKDLDVPVIPVHLEGVWGSIFSFEGGKFIWKWPKRIPYPITVTFGKPMRNPTPAEVRQVVMDMGADAFAEHHKGDRPLFDEFLDQAKAAPTYEVAVDSSGQRLSYLKLLTAASIVGGKMK